MNNLHVYTGEGKGKTTAAMGLALRSLGHGNRVLIAQFMKNGISGELKALEQLPNATVRTAPPIKGFVTRLSDGDRQAAADEQRCFADSLISLIEEIKPQTVILDELNVALNLGMLGEETALRLIDCAMKYGETAATGRGAPDWLIEKADYVSRIEAQKHPYNTRKQPARKGVEW